MPNWGGGETDAALSCGLVADHERDCPSRWTAVVSIAGMIGRVSQMLDGVGEEGRVDSGMASPTAAPVEGDLGG